jgi:DNA-binding NarL/FixJ family response regulator
MFSSQLFNIVMASTITQARTIINAAQTPWHCWILDIMIGEEDGLTLLEMYPNYPYIIMLSGLRSMTRATEALQKGALTVFDKNPSSLDLLYDEVCRVAAIGFILGGKKTQYLSVFSILKEHKIETAQQWAHKAFITERQLERICSIHSPLTPRLIIPLFYALFHFLRRNISLLQENVDQSIDEFYSNHISFVIKHIQKYQQDLSL